MKIFRSAGGLVVGPGGKILVVNQNSDSWSLPKGHVDPGETDLKAAVREIAEESGVTDLTLVAPLGSYVRTRLKRGGGEDRSQKKRLVFFLFRTGQTRLKPSDPHNPEARWINPKRVGSMLTHPKDKLFFKKAWRRACSMVMSETSYWKSPLGWLKIETEGRTLCRIGFGQPPKKITPPPSWVTKPLGRYFAKRSENLDSLRRVPQGTEFQKRVWSALGKIPRGKTATYAEIARRAGRPKAVRAAGSAVGANPLCLVIPCHRVIGSDGSIGGFAFGTRIKRELLKREGVRI